MPTCDGYRPSPTRVPSILFSFTWPSPRLRRGINTAENLLPRCISGSVVFALGEIGLFLPSLNLVLILSGLAKSPGVLRNLVDGGSPVQICCQPTLPSDAFTATNGFGARLTNLSHCHFSALPSFVCTRQATVSSLIRVMCVPLNNSPSPRPPSRCANWPETNAFISSCSPQTFQLCQLSTRLCF